MTSTVDHIDPAGAPINAEVTAKITGRLVAATVYGATVDVDRTHGTPERIHLPASPDITMAAADPVSEDRRRKRTEAARRRAEIIADSELRARALDQLPYIGKSVDTRMSVREMPHEEREQADLSLIEAAWGIIANVSGSDWGAQNDMWRTAAERWRHRYHERLELTDVPVSRPTVVCLCGSGRFRDGFNAANDLETRAGRIVLAPGVFVDPDDGDPWAGDKSSKQFKAMLDVLHFRKIDISDEILVINGQVDGCEYVGESTQHEIDYARATGKPVRYLYVYPDVEDDE